ncbi:ATP-binding protein [Aureimonas frigidaquae]|uniref:ATP-binding protein n=1 Tax=Aureimonas frigidaquae TaxID=424757 RepID=UPI00078136B3|nr:ATP-binding protein [Aureimonas frigidaquae]
MAETRSRGTIPAAEAANRTNLLLVIQLRWIAVAGQVATIALVHTKLGIALPLREMGTVLALIVLANLASYARYWFRQGISDTELFLQLLIDVAALTAQLYFSGGALNPFVSLYLLQTILGAVLLTADFAWALTVVTTLCFAGLAIAYEPIAIPHPAGPAAASLFVQGLFIAFLLVAVLLVYFVIRINRNLAIRDAGLAELRQQAAEEDHIVRIGLLASGAAHELGTPLATLSVILNDWSRAPAFRSDGELAQELSEAEAQLDRCKAIVSSILTSAGQTRGEGTLHTSVASFFTTVVERWKGVRQPKGFDYVDDFAPDAPMIADLALEQVVFNLLDNALEAGSHVTVELARDEDAVVLTVSDDGPGFAPQVLEGLGKPYLSTKGRPGAGLGLFLVTNVVRKLGGRLTARNQSHGGAVVTLRLPLASMGRDTP